MTVLEIIKLLKYSIDNKSYDFVPTQKNRNSRKKYGITITELENFLKTINEKDLYSGPEKDRDFPDDEVFIFIKKFKSVYFYVKIKKDNTIKYDRIKILSCHEKEY